MNVAQLLLTNGAVPWCKAQHCAVVASHVPFFRYSGCAVRMRRASPPRSEGLGFRSSQLFLLVRTGVTRASRQSFCSCSQHRATERQVPPYNFRRKHPRQTSAAKPADCRSTPKPSACDRREFHKANDKQAQLCAAGPSIFMTARYRKGELRWAQQVLFPSCQVLVFESRY